MKNMTEYELLKNAKVIAVLGFSPNPLRTSCHAAQVLINSGYIVYLVNPKYTGLEFMGRQAIQTLSQIPEHIDIIDVFRKSESIPGVVDEMIALKPGTVWFQLGISSPESEAKLKKSGINIVSNKCVMQVLE